MRDPYLYDDVPILKNDLIFENRNCLTMLKLTMWYIVSRTWR